jgi:hypothetical protein
MCIVKVNDIRPEITYFLHYAAGGKGKGLIEESGRLGKLVDHFFRIDLSNGAQHLMGMIIVGGFYFYQEPIFNGKIPVQPVPEPLYDYGGAALDIRGIDE